jgi:undecaprenyl diphosphate synthase
VVPFEQSPAAEDTDFSAVPRHVAIIMDGNRRWAKLRGLPPSEGHAAGVKALLRTVQEAGALGIEIVTVYAFSTENWNRTQEEVSDLLQQVGRALQDYAGLLIREGVRLSTIGDIDLFPEALRAQIGETCRQTQHLSRRQLVLALNYGGRNEICRAVQRLLESGSAEVTEEALARHLDTAPWPDPDLVIRTSGEMRISNFLPWQICYAELHVSEVLWPDFGAQDLRQAIAAYQHRERRIGR